MLDLTWDYPVHGPQDEPDAAAVLSEISGRASDGSPLSSYTQLNDDGSTICGCWIYCGVNTDGVNQAARRKPGTEQSTVAPEWGWAWPANRRVLYNRASADPSGAPWSERKALVWWDADAVLTQEAAFAEAVANGRAHPRVLITVGAQEPDSPNPPESFIASLPPDRAAALKAYVAMASRWSGMVSGSRALATRLQKIQGGPGYEVRFVAFEGEDHASVLPAALGRGMRFAFVP